MIASQADCNTSTLSFLWTESLNAVARHDLRIYRASCTRLLLTKQPDVDSPKIKFMHMPEMLLAAGA